MIEYAMKEDEVVLYKGQAKVDDSQHFSDILLTNVNLVITTRIKKIFAKDEVYTQVFPLSELKVYQNTPQLKQKGNKVELFFANKNIVIEFSSLLAPHKFVNELTKLLTGKTASERGADKVKGFVGIVDDTLGIDTIGAIKGIAENGLARTVLGGLGCKKSAAQTTQTAVMQAAEIAKGLLSQNEAKQPQTEPEKSALSIDQQIETMKKLKELVDSGILTQEEFETKKKEIMKL